MSNIPLNSRVTTSDSVSFLKDFFETILLPPKEFCKKLGLSKETEEYLEKITKKEAEKEQLLCGLCFN